MLRKLMIVLALIWAAQVGAQEKDNRTPLEKYEGAQLFGALSCSITFKLAQAYGESASAGMEVPPEKIKDADYRVCITDQKRSLKAAYDAALKGVKKAAAKNALKEHFISAVSRLEGIAPNLSELKLHYEQRQSANEARVKENWTRFEVEN